MDITYRIARRFFAAPLSHYDIKSLAYYEMTPEGTSSKQESGSSFKSSITKLLPLG